MGLPALEAFAELMYRGRQSKGRKFKRFRPVRPERRVREQISSAP
jgi:hypothetical protein